MPTSLPRPKPLVVVILDGWGISFLEEGNAIAQADTPTMDAYARYFPSASLSAASAEVGLPWGEVGNSETGHRNIGAGTVQYQALPLIDRAISNKQFFKNPVLLSAINHAKENNSKLHLMGLVSPGGVHSHMKHLFALLEMCSNEHFKERVYIHMFTDGRDSPPQSADAYLKQLEDQMGKHGVGKIASVTGRFYAMDRNKNWDRTEAFYNLVTGGRRISGAPNARKAIEQAYETDVFDEMIPPTAITRGGDVLAKIEDNDAVVFFNFRPDRARQLTEAFATPAKVGFETKPLNNVHFVTLHEYDTELAVPSAFADEKAEFPLARVIADAGLKQFHIAETEKYAHVTYYLNVGHEVPFPGEEHALIPSSNVESFTEEPGMQAEAITDRVIYEIEQSNHDVYFINYANADMLGHTGDFKATIEACAFVDRSIKRLEEAVLPRKGALLITADHGNAEELNNPETGAMEKDHTGNPVPLHYVASHLKRTTPKSEEEVIAIFSTPIGVLADIAPTVLDVLQIPKPSTMTGVSLLSSLR